MNSDSDRWLHTRNNKKISSCAFLLFKYNRERGGGMEAPSIVRKKNIRVKHFGMLTDYEANSLKSVARQLSELIAYELKINYYKIDF